MLIQVRFTPRSFSNDIIAEIARYVGFKHQFGVVQPSLSTSLKAKQNVHQAYALVQGSSSQSNLLKPSWTTLYNRNINVCSVFSHEFGVVRFFRTSSTFILKGMQDKHGSCALVLDGSSASNLLEPFRTTLLQGVQSSYTCVRGSSTTLNLL